MDQVVFVFDLEQIVPLEGIAGELDEGLLEEELNNVISAALKIATFCTDAGRINDSRRDLPSLGFRFYSSTEYFSVPPQLTGDWYDLSLSSWDSLEGSLHERFESVLAAVRRSKLGGSLKGRKTQTASLKKVLEEVCALYSWDRPALHSPVKKGRKAFQKMGNSVVIVTKIPGDKETFAQFLGLETMKKSPSFRDVADSFLSKRVKCQFTGELNIKLHLLDTGEQLGNERAEIVTLFSKALREVKGGVLPLSSVSKLFTSKSVEDESGSLVCLSKSVQRMPGSAVIQAHLAEVMVPSKTIEKRYTQDEVTVGEVVIGLEMVNEDVKLTGMESRGFIRSTFFKPGQKWKQMLTVWSVQMSNQFAAILLYMGSCGNCLILENHESIMAVMFYQTETSATLCLMDKVESHFYHLLLSLDTFIPTITLTDEVKELLADEKSLQFSPCKKPIFTTSSNSREFDTSTIENWRLPDLPNSKVFNSLKAATASLTSQNGSYHKLMLGVRESYTSRTMVKGEAGKENSAGVNPRLDEGVPLVPKLERKQSVVSTSSTVSMASSGLRELGHTKGRKGKMSRGDVLRQLAERNRSLVVESGDDEKNVDSATFVKESVLGAKSKAAVSFIEKMGDPNINTDNLIEVLITHNNEVVKCEDDLRLAGFAEACVSVLLKHLDTTGVSKSSLEEVVKAKLLLDVASIAKKYSGNPKLRVAHHKVQVLLRMEVHWLLASEEKQEQFEDSILAHLRQISLHGSIDTMTEFLSLVLTECYVDRQPDLLSLLYDELDQERPQRLNDLISPSSVAENPSSVGQTSMLGSNNSGSQWKPPMAPPPDFTKPVSHNLSSLTRSFRARPKSFDTSLIRQINIGAGRRERKNCKVVTTGRMITKSKVSAKKRNIPHKSPRKTKSMVKRNLTFDDGKSPRKKVSITTPSKVRKFTPRKFTPGKQHRVLCPETPKHKAARIKSDGNTSIAETPDKGGNYQASLSIRRRASFYSGAGSRNVQKFEDSFNASLLTGNTSSLGLNSSVFNTSARRDSAGSGEAGVNKSFVLFPHLLRKKRKREESLGGADVKGLNSSISDREARSKVPRLDSKSPRNIRRRLDSFSESSQPPSTLLLSKPTFAVKEANLYGAVKPLESTCVSVANHLDHHLGEVSLDISNIPINNQTPKKGQKTPRKNVEHEDFFSPNKKVQFNMTPQLPTPKSGKAAKSILKTPLKGATPLKSHQSPFLTPSRQNLFKTPVKTPSRVPKFTLTPIKDDCINSKVISVELTPSKSPYTRSSVPSPLTTHCSSRKTPVKSPARRDIVVSSAISINLSETEVVKTPIKSTYSLDSAPNSPIIVSTRKRISPGVGNHGFPTPSPRCKAKVVALGKVARELGKGLIHSFVGEPSGESTFLPPMMSTLQNLPVRGYLKDPSIEQSSFKEPNVSEVVPQETEANLEETEAQLPRNQTTHVTESPATLNSTEPITLTTQDIINCSSLVNLSSTIIKPSNQIPSNLFDNSALLPAPIDTTVCGSNYLSPTELKSNELVPIRTPTKQCLVECHSEVPAVEKTPVKVDSRLESTNALFHNEQQAEELELVSPAKRVGDKIARNVDSDSDEEIPHAIEIFVSGTVMDEIDTESVDEQVVSNSFQTFRKTDSELSLATSSDRATPEPHPDPSSGYSSEPQPDPPSPCYSSDHSSPGNVQVSSPNKPHKKVQSWKEKELASLQDHLTGFYSPVEGRRKRKSTVKDVSASEDVVNESGYSTPVKNAIALHSESPLGNVVEDEVVPSLNVERKFSEQSSKSVEIIEDVKDEIVYSTALERKCSEQSNKSIEIIEQPKIRIPKELAGLNDNMSPFFSTQEGKRKCIQRVKPNTTKNVDLLSPVLKRRKSSVAAKKEMSRAYSREKKTRRKSVRPLNYKEESEDSQTDDEELIRLIEERFGDEYDEKKKSVVPDQLEDPNFASKGSVISQTLLTTGSELVSGSPGRFKCDYCTKLFKSRETLIEHKQQEIEQIQNKNTRIRKCLRCGKIFPSVEKLTKHNLKEKCIPKGLSDPKTLDLHVNEEINIGKVKKSPDIIILPKPVAQLQDKLSVHDSPSSQVRIRKAPDRLAEVYNSQLQITPRSKKVRIKTAPMIQEEKGPSKIHRKKLFRIDSTATSTPNQGRVEQPIVSDTPIHLEPNCKRRSVRERNVSYAEFPDFDSSNTEESDITTSPKVIKKKQRSVAKRFVLASKNIKSPVRSKNLLDLVDFTLSPTYSNHSIMTLSPKITKHFKERKKKGLVVKNLNNSQEIQDVSSALDESQECFDSPDKIGPMSPNNFKSPGKYFSIAQVTETPTGQIKMKLNRIIKPHQTPGSNKLEESQRTPEKQNYPSSVKFHRLNRSACKELGVSPNKLQTIIASSPDKRSRGEESQGHMEKENQPTISEACRKLLKREHQVNKTPRIKIVKVPSEDVASGWKAETVFSPIKGCSPLKPRLPNLTNSPRSFSPLSGGSIAELENSPIIATQVFKKDRKTKKVNKQLAYN